MKQKGPKSRTRLQDREVVRKVIPAIKLLSSYMHNTSPEAPKKDFHGYEIPVGTFKDSNGIVWQLQLSAVCSNKKFIKNNEIKPIIRKGAWLFKLRLFAKVFIDKLFQDEVVQ